MNILRLFILFLFLPASSISQKGNSYIGWTSGISVPVGKYASKQLDGGSFAQPGWNVSMEGVWFLHNKIGFGLQAGYYAHPVDVRSLSNQKVLDDPFLEDLSIRSDPYRALTFTGLVHYSIPVSKQISFTPKAGGGILYGFSPYQLNKAVYFLIGSQWTEKTSTRDWAGYVTAGGMFRLSISSCIDLLLKTEYGYGTLRYLFLTGTGDIREDVHRFMVVDVAAGFTINL
jgi:hypothetical protein